MSAWPDMCSWSPSSAGSKGWWKGWPSGLWERTSRYCMCSMQGRSSLRRAKNERLVWIMGHARFAYQDVMSSLSGEAKARDRRLRLCLPCWGWGEWDCLGSRTLGRNRCLFGRSCSCCSVIALFVVECCLMVLVGVDVGLESVVGSNWRSCWCSQIVADSYRTCFHLRSNRTHCCRCVSTLWGPHRSRRR